MRKELDSDMNKSFPCLTKYGNETVKHVNRVYKNPATLSFKIYDKVLELTITDCIPEWFKGDLCIVLKSRNSNNDFVIEFGGYPVIETIKERFGTDCFADLPRPVQLTLITDCFQPLLELFNQKMQPGLEIKEFILECQKRDDYQLVVPFILKEKSKPASMYGRFLCSGESAETVVSLIEHSQYQRFRPPGDFPHIEASLLMGSTFLTGADLKSIELCDVVFIEIQQLSIAMGWQLDVTVSEVDKNKFKVEAIVNYSDKTNIEMNVRSIDDLEIQLVFEIGKISVPLETLRTIQKGTILELHTHIDNCITMKVNNSIIGKGDLVQIGDSLGCRIKTLFDKIDAGGDIITHESKER